MEAENFIERLTRSTKKKLRMFAEDHYAALDEEKTNPLIQPLYDRTVTLHTDYKSDYDVWFSKRGIYKGKTAEFEGILLQLPDKVAVWEAFVIITHPRESPTYIQIFPNGRSTFSRGTYEDRVSKVQALFNTLDTIAFANNPKADVQTFYNLMNTTRVAQQSAEQGVDNLSDSLEAKRISLSSLLYGNYGLLIDIFRDTPDEVNRFYDYSILRRRVSDESITGTVESGQVVNILSEGITDETQFVLSNTGTVVLQFFSTPVLPEGNPENLGIRVQPGNSTTATVLQLGNSGDKCLNVQNLDTGGTQGSFSVDIE